MTGAVAGREALDKGHTRIGRCHNGLGLCHTSLGELDLAVASFDASIDAEPDNPRAWHNRSTAKARLGRQEEAEAEALMATELAAKDRRGGHSGRTTAAMLAELASAHPDCIALRCFDREYFQTLGAAEQRELLRCMACGIENPDARMGCHALQPDDYERFQPFFSKALAAYHKVAEDAKHVGGWDMEGLESAEGGRLDLATRGLPPLEMRARAGRNLRRFPLPGAMTLQQRVELEGVALTAITQLITDPDFGGKYYSLTPGHACCIPTAQYHALVEANLAFKDLSQDRHLLSAGIAKDWPHGRGVYISEDQRFVIWVGEMDHLAIVCMERTTVLNDLFERLAAGISTVEQLPGMEFAVSETVGVVTSCPTQVGTGMRASLRIDLPNLTVYGATDEAVREVVEPLGLAIAKVDKVLFTPVEISPRPGITVTEADIIALLFTGAARLYDAENGAVADAEKRRLDAIRDREMARHTEALAAMEGTDKARPARTIEEAERAREIERARADAAKELAEREAAEAAERRAREEQEEAERLEAERREQAEAKRAREAEEERAAADAAYEIAAAAEAKRIAAEVNATTCRPLFSLRVHTDGLLSQEAEMRRIEEEEAARAEAERLEGEHDRLQMAVLAGLRVSHPGAVSQLSACTRSSLPRRRRKRRGLPRRRRRRRDVVRRLWRRLSVRGRRRRRPRRRRRRRSRRSRRRRTGSRRSRMR